MTQSDRVARDLRERVENGEWPTGRRLPGEHQLATHYGVSRSTVRTALQDLESRGLTVTRHGSGTVVVATGHDHQADIRRLESMTETIRRRGLEPGMRYRSISIRTIFKEEAEELQLSPTAEVVEIERALTADTEVVAFSYDVIPVDHLGGAPDPSDITGSVFALLGRHGHHVAVSTTELHAAHGDAIGWGERPEDPSYLVLVQNHLDGEGRPVFLSSTYFIEGRFPFGLVRHR